MSIISEDTGQSQISLIQKANVFFHKNRRYSCIFYNVTSIFILLLSQNIV